jgi:hypothetical protein
MIKGEGIQSFIYLIALIILCNKKVAVANAIKLGQLQRFLIFIYVQGTHACFKEIAQVYLLFKTFSQFSQRN